jgi:hypothetical protein
MPLLEPGSGIFIFVACKKFLVKKIIVAAKYFFTDFISDAQDCFALQLTRRIRACTIHSPVVDEQGHGRGREKNPVLEIKI